MPANLAVRDATSTIPIVMSNGADPVAFGLVQSLSHPGGNVTGLTNFAETLASKGTWCERLYQLIRKPLRRRSAVPNPSLKQE
jgi:ABC transporter substrate binding protein